MLSTLLPLLELRVLVDHAARAARRLIVQAALAAVASLLALAACGCAAAAAWQWALPRFGPVGAPLAVAACLAVACCILGLWMWLLQPRRPRPTLTSGLDPLQVLAAAAVGFGRGLAGGSEP
jgi:hypothetical protein